MPQLATVVSLKGTNFQLANAINPRKRNLHFFAIVIFLAHQKLTQPRTISQIVTGGLSECAFLAVVISHAPLTFNQNKRLTSKRPFGWLGQSLALAKANGCGMGWSPTFVDCAIFCCNLLEKRWQALSGVELSELNAFLLLHAFGRFHGNFATTCWMEEWAGYQEKKTYSG